MKRAYLSGFVATLVTICVSGCSSALAPTKVEKPATHVVQQRLVELCMIRKGLDPAINNKTEACITDQTSICDSTNCVRAYAEAGYLLTEEACNNFFDALVSASNNTQMAKADLVAAGTAAATILALSNATTKAIGNTAALFGLGAVMLDNWQKYNLLTPYPIQTRGLVLSALNTYRQAYPPQDASDIVDADGRVSSYARICSYSGIADLAGQAIAKATPVASGTTQDSIFSDTERAQSLSVVQAILGLAQSDFKDQDYVLLEVAYENVAQSATADKFLGELSPAIKGKLSSASDPKHAAVLNQVGAILAAMAKNNTKFKAAIDELKKQNPTNAKTTNITIPSSITTPRRGPPTITIKPSGF